MSKVKELKEARNFQYMQRMKASPAFNASHVPNIILDYLSGSDAVVFEVMPNH